jgi:hypothetical protein
MQDCNFTCGSLWVWNLVFDIKQETYTEGILEQDPELDIWTEEGWDDGGVEKTA